MLIARRPTAHRLANRRVLFRLTCLVAGLIALAAGPAQGQLRSLDQPPAEFFSLPTVLVFEFP